MRLKFRHVEGDFIDRCKFVVGKGNLILFWKVIWVGESTLRFIFSDLYDLSDNKNDVVSDIGE